MSTKFRMYPVIPLLTMVALSGLGSTTALAQSAPVRLEIMPAENAVSSMNSPTVTVPTALLAQTLRRANYQVIALPSPVPNFNGTPPSSDAAKPAVSPLPRKLGIRASVQLQTRLSQQGGKAHFFAAEKPTTVSTVTDYLVLLEVIALDEGEVICVGEGKASFRSNFNAVGGMDSVPPMQSAVSNTESVLSTLATGTGQNHPTAPLNPSVSAQTPPVPSSGAVIGTAATGNYSFSPQGQNGFGNGAGDAGMGTAALRIAVQNAVLSLTRRRLTDFIRKTGSHQTKITKEASNTAIP